MASVLSLRPQSPFKRSFSDSPHLPSYSPFGDNSLSALQDIASRNASACSLYSSTSIRPADLLRGNENTPPPPTVQSLSELSPSRNRQETPLDSHRKQICVSSGRFSSQSRSTAPSEPYSKKRKETSSVTPVSSPHHRDVNKDTGLDEEAQKTRGLYDLYEAIRIPLPDGSFSNNAGSEPDIEGIDCSRVDTSEPPFRRWMSTLRRRHIQRQKDTVAKSLCRSSNVNAEVFASLPVPQVVESECRASMSMSSSIGYITAVTSASITVTNASIAPRSDAGPVQAKARLRKRRSNFSDTRISIDSNGMNLGPVVDEGAWLRSLQRRRIVEEIMSSEESYISDLKVLINDYFTLWTSAPTLSIQTRISIQRNIFQILQLHQDLLADIHQAVPHVDSHRDHETYPITKAKHVRFHSADMFSGRVSEHRIPGRLRHSLDLGRSPDRRPETLVTDTRMVGRIAKIFNKHMKRFFAYEEYGAHWTAMSQDLTTICKGFHGWSEYEKGVEALSKVIASENHRESSSRKALSFPDLLIKPIQRVCKYPLLFEELCRHTPVYDDPEAHAELEKALFRFQETIREVNKAKDDPRRRKLIEISWQLQDRLVFEEQSLSRALIFRLLGHVLVCGVLHVAYQTPEHIKGQYMLCVLYKSCLVLATTNRLFTPYQVAACISLANGSVEGTDNGRGLQCHTAPYSWKLVFEHSHRLHEVIISACSPQEEDAWKTQLCERIVRETHDFGEGQSTMQDMFSTLSLDIRSIGPIFGHADSLVRRMSVHRAATLGSKSNVAQVIIKNTHAQKMPESSAFTPNFVTRSQSHMSSNHVPTLAPRRAERIRLETALEDVWTKEILPYPGMGNRKVENHIRASANSVMRKLSMASIASNFSRRSPSFSSLSNPRSEDSLGSRVQMISRGEIRARSAADRHPAPAVVDFHSAPAAFLPTDFEIQDTRGPNRRRRLANHTIGMECPIEKNVARKDRHSRRLSTHVTSYQSTEQGHRFDSNRTTYEFNTTTPRPTDSPANGRMVQEIEKQKSWERKEEALHRTRPSGIPQSKTFLKKHKSKMLKFWM